MKSLTAITIISVAVMIMASAGYYFYNNSINESSYPSYHVDMHLNTTIPVPYYPIQVNSNLTGNGTYQQLLTFSDPSHYGINANGSNLAFYDGSNNTHLYAWIQSINSTSMQVWIKNYNASNVIDMQVLPSFENLFSSSGYLGYNNSYFNAINVFPRAYNFVNNTTLSDYFGFIDAGIGNPYYANNGLKVISNSISDGQYIGTKTNYYNQNVMLYISSLTVNGTKYLPSVEYQFNGIGVRTHYFGNTTDFFLELNNTGYSGYGFSFETTINGAGPYSNLQSLNVAYWIAYNDSHAMPTFTIGAFTNMTDHAVASYLSNSITIPMPNWFNLTLKAYTNYSFTFHYNNTPLYFTYDGLINNTIYTGFLDSNITLDIHFIALGYSGKTELIVGR